MSKEKLKNLKAQYKAAKILQAKYVVAITRAQRTVARLETQILKLDERIERELAKAK